MIHWCTCSLFQLCFISYLGAYRWPFSISWQVVRVANECTFLYHSWLKNAKFIPEDIISHCTLLFQVNVFCLELLWEHCPFSLFPNENHMLVAWDLSENSNAVSDTWFWLFASTAISREVMKNSEWQLFYYKYYHLGKEVGEVHNEPK